MEKPYLNDKSHGKTKRQDVICLFVGDFQGRKNYLNELKNLISQSVDKILEYENQIDMAAIYKLADVVVSCSTDPEAFGRVVAEAQAMGDRRLQ